MKTVELKECKGCGTYHPFVYDECDTCMGKRIKAEVLSMAKEIKEGFNNGN